MIIGGLGQCLLGMRHAFYLLRIRGSNLNAYFAQTIMCGVQRIDMSSDTESEPRTSAGGARNSLPLLRLHYHALSGPEKAKWVEEVNPL